MEGNPCQDAYDAYVQAMNNWVRASNALQRFAAIGPLDPLQDVEPISLDDYIAASDKAEAAHEDYLEKLEAYFQCLEDHGILKKRANKQ